MYNNGKSIDSMNFEELRNFIKLLYSSIEELNDKLVRTMRNYDDTLCNISKENISIELINEQKEFVNSTVSAANEKLTTAIEQTADSIRTLASNIDNKLLRYTTIEQTADSISTLASSQVNLSDAEEIESSDYLPDNGDENIYKVPVLAGGTVVGETYYYYNDLIKDWVAFQGNNIYTVFKQTSKGFEFKGNVIIDGDAVITKNLKAQKIVSQDGNEIALLTMVSNGETEFPDLTYYGKIKGDYQELFGVRYDGTGTSYIRLNGINIGYVGINKEKFYPIGTWCFSEDNGTKVEGLGVVPVFGE